MLTRNDRQEALCRAYVRAVAAFAGVICAEPEKDYGVDLCLRRVRRRDRRHLDAGGQIDLQLKSTTTALIDADMIRYDLEATAYEDLREETDNCPRILVLLVLPEQEADWLEQTPEQLILRHCGTGSRWLGLHLPKPPERCASRSPERTSSRLRPSAGYSANKDGRAARHDISRSLD